MDAAGTAEDAAPGGSSRGAGHAHTQRAAEQAASADEASESEASERSASAESDDDDEEEEEEEEEDEDDDDIFCAKLLPMRSLHILGRCVTARAPKVAHLGTR